jgi:hypothetical protein
MLHRAGQRGSCSEPAPALAAPYDGPTRQCVTKMRLSVTAGRAEESKKAQLLNPEGGYAGRQAMIYETCSSGTASRLYQTPAQAQASPNRWRFSSGGRVDSGHDVV